MRTAESRPVDSPVVWSIGEREEEIPENKLYQQTFPPGHPRLWALMSSSINGSIVGPAPSPAQTSLRLSPRDDFQ